MRNERTCQKAEFVGSILFHSDYIFMGEEGRRVVVNLNIYTHIYITYKLYNY